MSEKLPVGIALQRHFPQDFCGIPGVADPAARAAAV
jgi:hypothetical protein